MPAAATTATAANRARKMERENFILRCLRGFVVLDVREGKTSTVAFKGTKRGVFLEKGLGLGLERNKVDSRGISFHLVEVNPSVDFVFADEVDFGLEVFAYGGLWSTGD